MTIQWFPGHMAKAKKEIETNIKLVDLVIELVDARAPISSRNPMLNQVIHNKKRIIVLMKKDLADEQKTIEWVDYFTNENERSVAVNVNDKQDMQKLITAINEEGKPVIDRLVRRGVNKRAIRAMIVGIPNVGKSTLINRLANRKIARIGDRPGITKHQQWIKIKNHFDLLDTPGILWPKFEDQKVGYRLAAIGTIKDSILSLQDICIFVITYLKQHYPDFLLARYKIEKDQKDMEEIFLQIGNMRGALESGGIVDYDKVAELVLRDLRSGRLGKITLESAIMT